MLNQLIQVVKLKLKQVFTQCTGNPYLQALLVQNVRWSQYLMGIGAGGEVLYSGEQAIFDRLLQIGHPPYCIFDVGANQGQFLQLLLDHLQSPTFSVHCFEPARETFQKLEKLAWARMGIKLNPIGLGSIPGQAVLYYDCPGSGLASLTQRRLDHFNIPFNQAETVNLTTIDLYCQENEIQHIHLLKIDVEGHELDVLKGAAAMFVRREIDMVMFEFGGCNIDTRTFFQDFWYFFTDLNFQLFRLTPSGYLSPITFYSEIDEQFRVTNFVAIAEHCPTPG